MSDPARPGAGQTIDCPFHGPSSVAFACQHVVHGVGCGFHRADPEDPLSDAWCDACESVRAASGGWNARSEAFAGIQMVCAECLEVAQYRNERPIGALELGVPADPGRFQRYVQLCGDAVRKRTDAMFSQPLLASHDAWRFDDQGATLTFAQGERPLAVGDVQLAGSYSEGKKSWLWAHANPGNPEHLVSESRRISVLGRVRNLPQLTQQEPMPMSVDSAWSLACLTAELIDGSGVYRAQMDDLHHFMVLFNVRRAV